MPDAMQVFAVAHAWRAWSRTEPTMHSAYYQFADIEAARAGTDPAKLAALIAEFDRVWQGRVVRTRDLLEVVETRDA